MRKQTHADLLGLEEMRNDEAYSDKVWMAIDRLVLVILATVSKDVRARLPKRTRKPKSQPLVVVDDLTYNEAVCANDPNCKIRAIKMYRERTNKGLKEAKDAVEAWMAKHLGFIYFTPDYDSRQQYTCRSRAYLNGLYNQSPEYVSDQDHNLYNYVR